MGRGHLTEHEEKGESSGKISQWELKLNFLPMPSSHAYVFIT